MDTYCRGSDRTAWCKRRAHYVSKHTRGYGEAGIAEYVLCRAPSQEALFCKQHGQEYCDKFNTILQDACEEKEGPMPDTTWLADLKDGDKVIIAQDGLGAYRGVRTVRLTETQIVIKSRQDGKEFRFRRDTGQLEGAWGHAWSHHNPFLLPYTEEAALQIHTTIAAATVCVKLGKLSRQTIEALPHDECAVLHAQLMQVLSTLKWVE